MDKLDIISYIKSSIEILNSIKSETLDRSNQRNSSSAEGTKRPTSQMDSLNNSPNSSVLKGDSHQTLKEYEAMIQKYEGDVRNHIRIEQQLKLHIESIQNKLEDIERSKSSYGKQFKEQID